MNGFFTWPAGSDLCNAFDELDKYESGCFSGGFSSLVTGRSEVKNVMGNIC